MPFPGREAAVRLVFVFMLEVVVVLLLFLFDPDIVGAGAVAVAAEDEDSGLLVGPIAVREGCAEDEDSGLFVGPIAVSEGCLLRRLLDCWRRALRRGESVEVVGVEFEGLVVFVAGCEKNEAGGGAVVVAGESIVEMLRLEVVELSS